MRTCDSLVPLLLTLLLAVQCTPISQPAYDNTQYNAQTQSFPVVQYKPQQLHFKPGAASRPVYEQQQSEGLQYYSSQPKQSAQSIQTPGTKPVQQSFLSTSQGIKQVDTSIYDQLLKSQQNFQRKPIPQPVYQPQPIKYATPTQQTQFSAKYQQVQVQPQQAAAPENEEKEDEGDFDPNPSYQFGFDVKDDQFTNYQTRKEERDGKKITGSYSVVDADGYIRTVKYTADPKEGFKAEVNLGDRTERAGTHRADYLLDSESVVKRTSWRASRRPLSCKNEGEHRVSGAAGGSPGQKWAVKRPQKDLRPIGQQCLSICHNSEKYDRLINGQRSDCGPNRYGNEASVDLIQFLF
ncbi:hypothetical protein GWI33_022522 [Rhynchophorus ferrugineus]|uniref:Uncharacterized protein n=1 Tax=Rhynchophorus ferrugineus TaxID=354439 RepID=A0A834M234_RHYFE|nr:hypothetical protein GWI33_022522 [Rhynchophorus ferrugineus]